MEVLTQKPSLLGLLKLKMMGIDITPWMRESSSENHPLFQGDKETTSPHHRRRPTRNALILLKAILMFDTEKAVARDPCNENAIVFKIDGYKNRVRTGSMRLEKSESGVETVCFQFMHPEPSEPLVFHSFSAMACNISGLNRMAGWDRCKLIVHGEELPVIDMYDKFVLPFLDLNE